MKKADKKLFLYALIMSGAVLLIILFAYMSDLKIDSIENRYENKISEQTKQVEIFSERLQLLQEENTKLSKELETLKNKKGETISSGETYNQAMKLLSDIYLLLEAGENDKAKKELSKFDTTTFDDTIINYKKALEKLVK